MPKAPLSDADRAAIGRETPLRLDLAVELAFPAGGMTARGLRREAEKGRLELVRVAGKDFVTLAAIERMLELCRVTPKAPASTSESVPAATPSGSSETDRVRSARARAQLTAERLRGRSPSTSRESTSRTSATVIQLGSP